MTEIPIRGEIPPLTLKGLIHELTADYTMADEPVIVSGWDSAGNLMEYTVTGIAVRQWQGKIVQSLEMRPIGDEETAS